MTARVFSAPWVLTGAPHASGGAPRPPAEEAERGRGSIATALRDGAIALDGDRILAVGPRERIEALHGRAERLDAVVLPALVNAHLHLELSHMAGRVTGGEGLAAWIQLFIAARANTREGEPELAMTMAAEDLVAAGVAAVGDVSNTLASVGPLARARLAGTVYHEVFGVTPQRIEAALAAAAAARDRVTAPAGLAIALSPHAVYSTDVSALERLLAAGPGSIHLAEDPDERALCAKGAGPFARMRASLSSARARPPEARSAVAAVARHLRPHHLVVHCVDLDGEDLRALLDSGATAVLCPRSNRHISGRLPPLPALLAAGIPLAVGTDSLASSPSLAPLAELAVLRAAFPEVPASTLLPLAWNGAAVGAPHVGALVAGRSPGVLAAPLAGARPDDPFEHLVSTFAAAERPFTWLARQAPPEARP